MSKRFKQSRENCIDSVLHVSTTYRDVMIEWLNELNDENEKLKKTNQELYNELQETMGYKSLKMGENTILEKENKQLKQQLEDCRKDFMEFKMQLIEVLQQNYNYAYNQRQRNLDETIIARMYEVLYQTIYIIAETMNVDIERFPKNGIE